MYERILVPLDGSDRAEQVRPHVQALAAQFGSEVTLIRVERLLGELLQETRSDASPDLSVELAARQERTNVEAAERYLQVVAGRLTADGARVSTRVLQGAPATMIVAA